MTAARIYTPDPEGACLVCGRPEGEHGRATWTDMQRACPPTARVYNNHDARKRVAAAINARRSTR